jgi:hypothetical protein
VAAISPGVNTGAVFETELTPSFLHERVACNNDKKKSIVFDAYCEVRWK